MTDDDDDDYELYGAEDELQTYAVRVAEDHQVVGIFAARSEEVLALIIDEVTDPSAVEILELGEGGFYVPAKTEAQFPMRLLTTSEGEPDEEVPADSDPLAGGTLSEVWFDRMAGGQWRRIASAQPAAND